LYALARQGIVVDRQPREITIHELVLLDLSGDRCRLRVTCSKGTYIRTLAEDLGWALACGAHLLALRRTAVAALSVEMAVTFDRLATLSDDERLAHLHAPDMLLLSLPAVVLPADLTQRFRHGNPVPSAGELGKYRVYCSLGHLLGVGERDPSGILRPRRLISST
ncbi:MAG TPA: tRNA pseudouridine(55) synthase TruB, partial [Accumulibacter sp.]|nr:tRNA pseudouridine(55) synthase TruB [Accumulibacter sp.]